MRRIPASWNDEEVAIGWKRRRRGKWRAGVGLLDERGWELEGCSLATAKAKTSQTLTRSWTSKSLSLCRNLLALLLSLLRPPILYSSPLPLAVILPRHWSSLSQTVGARVFMRQLLWAAPALSALSRLCESFGYGKPCSYSRPPRILSWTGLKGPRYFCRSLELVHRYILPSGISHQKRCQTYGNKTFFTGCIKNPYRLCNFQMKIPKLEQYTIGSNLRAISSQYRPANIFFNDFLLTETFCWHKKIVQFVAIKDGEPIMGGRPRWVWHPVIRWGINWYPHAATTN